MTVKLPSSFAFTVGAAGAVLSVSPDGVFALAVPASDSLSEASLASAVTSVPSFTLSAGIVTTPEAGSIFRPLFAGRVQLP